MMPQYDADRYRQLGVGTALASRHLMISQVTGEPVPVHNSSYGYILDGTESFVYLEEIPSTIAKDTYPSGAARSAAEGRGRFDLIPFEAMQSLARRYEMGAKHFGEKNWERGQPLSRLLSSLRRHAHQIGYDYSEDHVGAVLWNAAAFVTMAERMRAGILPKELDDIGFFLNEKATQQ